MNATTTTSPEHPTATPGHLPGDELLTLVERYEAKWPEIAYAKGGSRARKAMQFVLEGRLLQGPDDLHTGHDTWTVNGNRCSKAGKWCECEDRIRTDPTYGKLCAHRLAVALKTHWLGDYNQRLFGAIYQLIDHDRTQLDLLVERDYAWHGQGERTTLAGWLDDHRQRHIWAPHLRVEFTLPHFQRTLAELGGWTLAELPEKLPGVAGHYRYAIHAAPGLDLTPELFYHHGHTGLMIERERTRRLLLADIAANLTEYLAGPFPLRLSDWEARRVARLHRELQQQQLTAAEVWSRLPAAVRTAILNTQKQE